MNQPQEGLKFLTCLMHNKVKESIFCLQFQLQSSVGLDCCVEKERKFNMLKHSMFDLVANQLTYKP